FLRYYGGNGSVTTMATKQEFDAWFRASSRNPWIVKGSLAPISDLITADAKIQFNLRVAMGLVEFMGHVMRGINGIRVLYKGKLILRFCLNVHWTVSKVLG